MKLCKHCEAIIPASSNICPLCGKQQPVKKAALASAEFELITPEIHKQIKRVWPKRTDFTSDQDWIKECIEHAKLMNLQTNSVMHHILHSSPQEDKIKVMKLYSAIKGYKASWVENQPTLKAAFNK
jgi:hypothetical protein